MAYEVNIGEIEEGAKIVPLRLAKLNSRIEFDEEDELLDLFVDAAGAEIENYIGFPVLLRAATYTVDHWFKSLQPKERLSAITKVSYVDEEDNEVVLAVSDYTLNKTTNTLVINKAEVEDFAQPLTVVANIGYAEAEMPADIKRAALLIFSNSDTYRENMPVKLDTSAKGLLRPYRSYE